MSLLSSGINDLSGVRSVSGLGAFAITVSTSVVYGMVTWDITRIPLRVTTTATSTVVWVILSSVIVSLVSSTKVSPPSTILVVNNTLVSRCLPTWGERELNFSYRSIEVRRSITVMGVTNVAIHRGVDMRNFMTIIVISVGITITVEEIRVTIAS